MEDANKPDDTGVGPTLQMIRDKAISAITHDADADTALLDILTRRIVTPSPDADAVEQAADDIRQLAEKRAES